MTSITDKLVTLWPAIALLIGACVSMLIGLSPTRSTRKLPAQVAALSLLVAGWLVWRQGFDASVDEAAVAMQPAIAWFVSLSIVGVGLLLLLVAAGVPDHLSQTQDAEARCDRGGSFEPGDVMRGEFFAFFLFSLAGAMLCAQADDLVWLFLALELTSLPTYVMVATARDRADAQESAVKYFFLGAMAAGVFLYGFTLIYGATGFTQYDQILGYIHTQAAQGQGVSPLLSLGLVLAVVGVSFKIAAVPMHFYTADVYQGAATPVTAFLAFVPKTAGFVSLIGLLGLAVPLGTDQLQPLVGLLWCMAVASMTAGNVLGLLQDNVKRVLAYSSIAHSGYMLVGLLVFLSAGGARMAGGDGALGGGLAALLFYLIAYGLATLGAFAVLGCVTRDGQEAQTFDDIAGLGRRHPTLGAVLIVSVLSLLGLPPMVGFLGKIYLFGGAFEHGYVWLVIIAVLNSAVSAVYYLRIIGACYFAGDASPLHPVAVPARRVGAAVAAIGAVVLGIGGDALVQAAKDATTPPQRLAQRGSIPSVPDRGVVGLFSGDARSSVSRQRID